MSKLSIELSTDLRRQLGLSEDAISGLRRVDSQVARGMLKQTFVTCWSAGANESVALWRLYADSPDAVAIKTSFARLARSFGRNPTAIYAGMVRYVDHETELVPNRSTRFTFDGLMHKRRGFEFEREVRAIVHSARYSEQNHLLAAQGRFRAVRVDLQALVEEIHVSQVGKDGDVVRIRDLLKRHRLDAIVNLVERSELAKQPSF